MERIESLKQKIVQEHQSLSLPWWRFAYPNFMLKRATEYHTLGLNVECDISIERVEKWLHKFQQKHHKKASRPTTQSVNPVQSPWTAEYLQKEISRLENAFKQRRILLPIPERDGFLKQLSYAKKLLDNEEKEEAQGIIFEVRKLWLRRMLRSQRAWARVYKQQREPKTSFKVKGSAAGPYNSILAVHQFTEIIGERDPIWVEDMLDLYNNLFNYQEKFGSFAKKTKFGIK